MEIKKKMLSPSSINLYRQCPQKYYYAYIQKLPARPNIHLIRGGIVHSILEEFFDLEAGLLEGDYKDKLVVWMLHLFKKHWNNKIAQIQNLAGSDAEFYEQDTKMMLLNWLSSFSKKIEGAVVKGEHFLDAFNKFTPLREVEYASKDHEVKGFIDAIEEHDGEVKIIDYKTSDKLEVNEDYKLQLAIYALLYHEKHQKLPLYVGIHFLRGGEELFAVDDEMLQYAKKEVKRVRELTASRNIEDYPKHVGPFCKWGTGQCDFFEVCMPFKKNQD